jgi:hypothetical protein
VIADVPVSTYDVPIAIEKPDVLLISTMVLAAPHDGFALAPPVIKAWPVVPGANGDNH